MVPDGVGVRFAEGVAVGVVMGVGVGVGISMMVGVGVGVMTVFCCSNVLEMSESCFFRTEDWVYKKIEADMPTPARIRRIKVSREEVGELFVEAGGVAMLRFSEGGLISGVTGVVNVWLSCTFLISSSVGSGKSPY